MMNRLLVLLLTGMLVVPLMAQAQDEYEKLKKDEQKIIEKIKESGSSDEIAKLYSELETISRRKTKIRNRS